MELGFTLSLILVVDSGFKQPVYIASLVLLAARMEEPKNGTETGIAYVVEGRPRLFGTRVDMEFVKNFTHPDFQAKSFTPQKCVICDSFFTN